MFQEVMGSSPEVKVIEYFCEWSDYEITITDIAKGAKIGRNQAYRVVESLIKSNVLLESKAVGRKKFFILDKNSKTSKNLKALFKTILIDDNPRFDL